MRLIALLPFFSAPTASLIVPNHFVGRHPRIFQLMVRRPVFMAGDDLESALDRLVRSEVEAALSGLEASLTTDDDNAIKLMEQKGQEVMANVLKRLEEDGEVLSSSLSAQIEALTLARQKEVTGHAASSLGACPSSLLSPLVSQMLAKYDESTAKLQSQMIEERQTIREVRSTLLQSLCRLSPHVSPQDHRTPRRRWSASGRLVTITNNLPRVRVALTRIRSLVVFLSLSDSLT